MEGENGNDKIAETGWHNVILATLVFVLKIRHQIFSASRNKHGLHCSCSL